MGWTAHALSKHNAPYLHMNEAVSLAGSFRATNGWNSERVTHLIMDLSDVVNCYDPRSLLPVVVSLQMEYYRTAAATKQRAAVLRPTTVCAVQSCQRVLGSLDPDPENVNSTINIFRDRDEPYLGDLVRDWESAKIRRIEPPLERINRITAMDMRVTPGIQMADMIAWTAHRCLTHPEDERAHCFWWAMRVTENHLIGRMRDDQTESHSIDSEL